MLILRGALQMIAHQTGTSLPEGLLPAAEAGPSPPARLLPAPEAEPSSPAVLLPTREAGASAPERLLPVPEAGPSSVEGILPAPSVPPVPPTGMAPELLVPPKVSPSASSSLQLQTTSEDHHGQDVSDTPAERFSGAKARESPHAMNVAGDSGRSSTSPIVPAPPHPCEFYILSIVLIFI